VTTDVDLYRRNVKLPARDGKASLTFSAIEMGQRQALRTIVFIHGFGGRAAYWKYQLEYFALDNRVIALDLRGHGLSDAPHSRYDVAELVDDVTLLLQALEVPARFTLVAHSFGGAVAAYFINKYPDRVEKLVLIASAVKFNLRWTGRTILKAPTPFLKAVRQFVPLMRIYPPAHVVNSWNRNALTIWDGSDYLKQLKIPVLVILGQRDLLFRQEVYREVATLIPGAQEIIIPVSAHQVMVERPDAVNRAIDHFLGKISPT
jgi:long-chain acyl-CoA synthetase